MKKIFSSFKARMFAVLSLIVLFIAVFLMIINTFVFEKFYTSHQHDMLKGAYEIVSKIASENDVEKLEEEIEQIVEKNNCDILIEAQDGTKIYASSNFMAKIKEQLFTRPHMNGMENLEGLEDRQPQESKPITKTEEFEIRNINSDISRAKLYNFIWNIRKWI